MITNSNERCCLCGHYHNTTNGKCVIGSVPKVQTFTHEAQSEEASKSRTGVGSLDNVSNYSRADNAATYNERNDGTRVGREAISALIGDGCDVIDTESDDWRKHLAYETHRDILKVAVDTLLTDVDCIDGKNAPNGVGAAAISIVGDAITVEELGYFVGEYVLKHHKEMLPKCMLYCHYKLDSSKMTPIAKPRKKIVGRRIKISANK